MANLKFKWGLHANLPDTITETDVGTIYVTKDEKGLYLGTESGKAPKRLQGVVQYYESATAFNEAVKPPYSTDVIYYIADQGALVRWDPTETSQYKFKVMNVGAAQFNTLSQNVSALRTDLGKPDDAAGVDENKRTAFSRIKQLEETVDALEKFVGLVDDNNNETKSLQERIEALSSEWNSFKNNDLGTKPSGYTGTIYQNIYDLKDARIKIESKLTNDVGVRPSPDNFDNSGNATGTLFERVQYLGHTIGKKGDASTKNTVYGAITGIAEDVAEHIKAANALTYKSGVETIEQWNGIKNAADTIRIGDLYIVTPVKETFDINGVQEVCYAGDLLIATAKSGKDEDADGFLAKGNIEWVHVASGYQKTMQGTLGLVDSDETTNKKAKLTLTSLNGSGTSGDLGEVTIASTNENLEITTSGSNMSINMVWGTF